MYAVLCVAPFVLIDERVFERYRTSCWRTSLLKNFQVPRKLLSPIKFLLHRQSGGGGGGGGGGKEARFATIKFSTGRLIDGRVVWTVLRTYYAYYLVTEGSAYRLPLNHDRRWILLPVEFFRTCRSSRGEGTIPLSLCSLCTLWKNTIFRSPPRTERAGWRSNDFLVDKSEKPVTPKNCTISRDKNPRGGNFSREMEAFVFLIIPGGRAGIDEIFNPRAMLLEVSRVVKMAKANDRQRGSFVDQLQPGRFSVSYLWAREKDEERARISRQIKGWSCRTITTG